MYTLINLLIDMSCNNPYATKSKKTCDSISFTKDDDRKYTSTCSCTKTNSLLQIDNDSKGLHVDIHRGLFSSKSVNNNSNNNNSIDWYQQLLNNVRWHRVKYKSNRFQKECETPCYTAFYGGRAEYKPYIPIPNWLQPLIHQVTSHLGKGVQFNAFLVRLYFDGNDEIAWHTDGRTFLGDEPTIASLSLGCKATFQLRRMNNVWPCADGTQSTEGSVDVNTPIERFSLNDGDLLVMRGNTQQHWHHRVPKEKGRGVRLNVNFRYILPGLDAERGQKTYYKYMEHGDCSFGEQPSWTFDEIMAKRGGMMNFVQRGVKRKVEHEADVDIQSTAKNRSNDEKQDQSCKTSDSSVAASTKATSHSIKSDNSNKNSSTQQYLASENVDIDVFMALPIEIQNEIVKQWKSQQLDSTKANYAYVSSNAKVPKRHNIKSNSKSERGTLHKFFEKR